MLTAHASPPAGGPRASALTRRAGFTLLELLMVLVVLVLVSGAVTLLLVRQQRTYNGTVELVQTRQQIRQAASMLPSDLRGISSVGGDIYAMTDSSLEFRSVFGSSVACGFDSNRAWVSTVPQKLAKGSVMTTWSVLPSAGDSFAIYDGGSSTTTASDDFWGLYQLKTVTPVTGNVTSGCPTSTGLVQPGDVTGTNPSYQLAPTVTLSKTIDSASAIRFFRRVHYSVYKAADNNWYLGYYDCKTGRSPVCNAVQPIAGPFRPYATDGTSGLQFAYFDSTGAGTANRNLVARIRVVVRGEGTTLVNLTGFGETVLRDSLRIEVGLRNRK